MNKESASQSAFWNLRVSINLAFCLLGLVLALLAFGLPPRQTALAQLSAPTEPLMEKDSPPDTTSYARPAIPEDYAPGGHPSLPLLELPSAFTTVVRDVVVSNTDPNLTDTDTFHDGEPSIAINPSDTNQIVISAFSGSWGANAPIWHSANGGTTWTKRFTVPVPPGVPAANGCPCDQAFDYDRSNGVSGTFLAHDIYSGTTTNPTISSFWNWLLDMDVAQRTNAVTSDLIDQPWLLVNRDPTTSTQDNVYVAYDELGSNSLRVAVSLGTNPPNFVRDNLSGMSGGGFVNPGHRLAVDPNNGAVYSLWQVRTGSGAAGTHNISYRLNRSTDGGQTWTLNGSGGGIQVATADSTQACPNGCGSGCTNNTFKFGTVNALLGGVLHAAVDPSNGGVFYVYGNRDSTTNNNRLAIRHLTSNGTGGLNIGAQVFVTGQVQAALPSVAVSSDGTVGVLYTQFDGMSSMSIPMFSVHLAVSTDHGQTFSTDLVLENFLSSATDNGDCRQRVLGDYQQVKAVGTTFYGTFTGNGVPFGRPFANHDPIFFKASPTTTTTHTLTVNSSNPNSGVGITVSPNDNNGAGNGTTQFTRIYNNNVTVSLAAPPSAGGNNFQKWQRDGSDWSTSLSTTVTMDANHTMTAVYTTTPTRTLTVASTNPNSGVGVTVSPNDNNGQGSGTTQFTRVYNNNQSVNLTAPPTAGGNSFQKWQRDGLDWSTSTSTSVTMDANHTMTAMYGIPPSPTPGCSTTITQSSTQTITPDNSVSCNNGTGHTDNSYWRAFNVGTFVGSNQYNVTSVSFGVERATGAGGTQPVTVRLYTSNGGAFPAGTLSQIAASTVNVPDSASGTVFAVPLVATVPAGAELVMEVFTPDGTVAGNLLFIGSNADSESGPSYLSAANCGFTTPTTTTAVGFPDMHIVFNVNGNCGGGPPPSPTPTATPCGTTVTFSNPAPITINDALPASPYPSNITVTGVINSVTKVTVTITGFNHTFPSDVDMLLVGPGGQRFILVSDVIGGTDAVDINWTLDDAAAAFIGSTGTPASGTFQPTNYTTCQDAFAAPAPAGPYLTPGGIGTPCGTDTLAAFNGVNPNGTWSLYVVDDLGADVGSISGGWSVNITTTGAGCASSTLGNISTRLRVETGNNVLIGGFIVTGTQPKKVIVRAIGPSLSSLFTGVLADPVLELHGPGGFATITNDNWRSTQEAEIIATGIPPSNNLESAIVATLPANNAAYTAIVRGVNNGTGVGVVEAYDLDRTVNSKLANISTRGLVQTGDNVMIGGLIVLGQSPLRVIVRAIGPSLPVAGALGDPTLELRDGSGTLLASDDDWRDGGQEAEIIATGVSPPNDLESAIVRNLAPGNYTAIVRGFDDTTGVGLVEAYQLQ